jgi:amino acid permease
MDASTGMPPRRRRIGPGITREDDVSSGTAAGGRSAGKIAAIVVLAVIGVLAIIAGVIYLTEPAKSLPSILGTITHPAARAHAHRHTRGAVALVVGVLCLVAAGIVAWRGRASRA